jgi:hypothetical protein
MPLQYESDEDFKYEGDEESWVENQGSQDVFSLRHDENGELLSALQENILQD